MPHPTFIYACVLMCEYVCIYIYICLCAYVWVCIYIYIYICVCACVCVCVCVCVNYFDILTNQIKHFLKTWVKYDVISVSFRYWIMSYFLFAVIYFQHVLFIPTTEKYFFGGEGRKVCWRERVNILMIHTQTKMNCQQLQFLPRLTSCFFFKFIIEKNERYFYSSSSSLSDSMEFPDPLQPSVPIIHDSWLFL